MSDMRFDSVAWAQQYGNAPYGRPVVTDIPGAGIDLRAMRRSGTSVPVWPAADAGPTFVQYGRGAPSEGTLGLGQSALLDAARYEIQGDVERTVTDIFQRYVVPVVVGTGLLSVFAFAMSLASYRRTLKANRSSRSSRARRRARGRR